MVRCNVCGGCGCLKLTVWAIESHKYAERRLQEERYFLCGSCKGGGYFDWLKNLTDNNMTLDEARDFIKLNRFPRQDIQVYIRSATYQEVAEKAWEQRVMKPLW